MIGTFHELLGAEKTKTRNKVDSTTVAPALTAKPVPRRKARPASTTKTDVASVITATVAKEPLKIAAKEEYKDASGTVFYGAEAARQRTAAQNAKAAKGYTDARGITRSGAEAIQLARADEKRKVENARKNAAEKKIAVEKAAREKQAADAAKAAKARADRIAESEAAAKKRASSKMSRTADDQKTTETDGKSPAFVEVGPSQLGPAANDDLARRLAALEAKGVEIATPPGPTNATTPAAPTADTGAILSRLDALSTRDSITSTALPPVQTSALAPPASDEEPKKTGRTLLFVVGTLTGVGAIAGIIALLRKRKRARRRGAR